MEHSGKIPYKCNQCEKAFKQNGNLKTHMLIHTGERPYQCNKCDKSYTQKGHLKDHFSRFHSGERPYKCNKCEKAFKHKSVLKRHMLIHTGESPYHCNHCDKSYNQKHSLKQHFMSIHTREGSYRCNQCYKYFTTSYSLKSHMINAKQCDKSFIKNSHLKTHMESRSHILQNNKINISSNHSENAESRVFACFICKEKFDNLNTCRQHMKTHMESKVAMLSKCGSTCRNIEQKYNSITPKNENRLNIVWGQNDNKYTTDEISIKIEHDIDVDIKHELDDYTEYKGINPSDKVINQSERDLQKTNILESRVQVSIKVEQDLVK